jgi:hypothetical protein
MSIAITFVQYYKCQKWLAMSSIQPITSIELPILAGTKLQQLNVWHYNHVENNHGSYWSFGLAKQYYIIFSISICSTSKFAQS